MATNKSRRSFLSTMGFIGLGSGFVSLIGVAQGVFAFWFPAAPYEPSKKSKIGLPEDFPKGETKMLTFEKENVFVFHNDEGLYAMSARCTHVGCAVTPTATGFICPCHGSKFDGNGKNTEGPAPTPLKWLAVSRAPDGQIVLDRGTFVEPGPESTLKISS